VKRFIQLLSTCLPRRHRAKPAAPWSASLVTWPTNGDRQTIFTHIHRSNHWGEPESLSGPGSTVAYTENIRQELPRLWEQLGAKIILDAPCGDFNWFSKIPRNLGIQYIGGDIVNTLVQENQTKYGDPKTTFIPFDIVSSPFPRADFWLCRDCLFHLPVVDVLISLRNYATSQIPYLCTSHHPECKLNTDIETGGFRQLNLELPPFNLGKAITYIDDWIEGYPQRQLALWHRQDVASALGLSAT